MIVFCSDFGHERRPSHMEVRTNTHDYNDLTQSYWPSIIKLHTALLHHDWLDGIWRFDPCRRHGHLWRRLRRPLYGQNAGTTLWLVGHFRWPIHFMFGCHLQISFDLTVTQGHIQVCPAGTYYSQEYRNFFHWTRDKLRLKRDPTASPFPVELVGNLICQYKTHKNKFLIDSKSLSAAAKSDKFKESTELEDWKPAFLN